MTECLSPFDLLLDALAVTSKEEKKSLCERALKLQEEVGELSEAVLLAQRKGKAGCDPQCIQAIHEECVDVILVALDVFYATGGNKESLCRYMQKKHQKWKRGKSK